MGTKSAVGRWTRRSGDPLVSRERLRVRGDGARRSTAASDAGVAGTHDDDGVQKWLKPGTEERRPLRAGEGGAGRR